MSLSHEGDNSASIPEVAIGGKPERCFKEPFLSLKLVVAAHFSVRVFLKLALMC